MALPGGHWEAGDRDLEATTLREVYEEVGIDLSRDGVLLGELPSLQARAIGRQPELFIVPFVFYLSREPTLVSSPEVAECMWVDVDSLMERREETCTVMANGKPTELPAWHIGGHPVWGLTHSILNCLFRVMEGSP
jgi:8-oxo-dGTP pyrophosphatase MutT (NUDIX family)